MRSGAAGGTALRTHIHTHPIGHQTVSVVHYVCDARDVAAIVVCCPRCTRVHSSSVRFARRRCASTSQKGSSTPVRRTPCRCCMCVCVCVWRTIHYKRWPARVICPRASAAAANRSSTGSSEGNQGKSTRFRARVDERTHVCDVDGVRYKYTNR